MQPHRMRFCFRFLATGIVTASLGLTPVRAQAQTLVSVATDSTPGDAPSAAPSVSADGRFVAFVSRATNLVPSDTNDAADVFVRDLVGATTTRISVTSEGGQGTGESGRPRITPDGRFVVFESESFLAPDDTPVGQCFAETVNEFCLDVYVHDRQTGATVRASASSSGVQPNEPSQAGEISDNGQFVVFRSMASNLVANDTNGVPDIFLRDLLGGTTIRVSRALDGTELPLGAEWPLISGDGRTITFVGRTITDPEQCASAGEVCGPYLHDRVTGTLTSFATVKPPPDSTVRSAGWRPHAISTDGRLIVVLTYATFRNRPPSLGFIGFLVYDRLTEHSVVDPFATVAGGTPFPNVTMSANGRVLGLENQFTGFGAGFRIRDRVTQEIEELQFTNPDMFSVDGPALSRDGRFVAAPARTLDPPPAPGAIAQIYLFDRDADGDGATTAWETRFGLDPANAADGAADPDGDGLSNQQEYAQGSHPTATSTRYFAEGAANGFFTTRLAAVNPGNEQAQVVYRFLGQGGTTSSMVQTLAPRSRATISLAANGPTPANDFSTVVESDRPIVVDRTMTWTPAAGYGAHAETSLAAPATTWYLAEGATHGTFDLFYLLQNANDVAAQVTITYLRLAPLAPVTKMYTVAAHSRRTIWVDSEGPDLEAVDTAASIVSTVPIVVERAMYSTRPGQPAFEAGHGGAGVTQTANRWFLAEGATGSFFDLYVLVANPSTTASELRVTYLLPQGDPFSKTYTVGGQQRLTISVQGEDPRLADTPVSIIVESTNDQPVVVERAMWWPKGEWYEAHVSAGATATGTRWAFAEGEVSTAAGGTETYILIANTTATTGTATLTLFIEGSDPIQATVDLPASSRVNVPVSTLAPNGARFGALVESSGVDIVVERAMYSSTGGQAWSAGTAALATRLP